MNEQFNLLRLELAPGQDGATRRRARIGGPGAFRPHPPLPDSGHELEPAERKFQPLVKRTQPLLDLRGGPDFLGQRHRERLDANVIELHGFEP